MARNQLIRRTFEVLLAAGLLTVLGLPEARADKMPTAGGPQQTEERKITLVPEQEDPAACTEGTTPSGRAACERWYFLSEKRSPDAWQEDHPAFSKKQRWYHVGSPEPAARPRVIVLQGVRFDFDKATIRPESYPILDRNLPALQSDVRVRIVGHADSRGTDAYNQGLSERRAQAVKDYYTNHGVPADRMEVEGRGESEPIAENEPHQPGASVKAENDSLHAGRVKNRRIELHIEDVVSASNR